LSVENNLQDRFQDSFSRVTSWTPSIAEYLTPVCRKSQSKGWFFENKCCIYDL